MSNTVRLSSSLPADEDTNGLDSKAQRLIDTPDEFLVCLVWGDTQKVVNDTDSGDHIPYYRIRRIEPLGDANDVADAVRELVQKAAQQRLGRTPVPFEQATVSEGFDPDQRAIDDEDA